MRVKPWHKAQHGVSAGKGWLCLVPHAHTRHANPHKDATAMPQAIPAQEARLRGKARNDMVGGELGWRSRPVLGGS